MFAKIRTAFRSIEEGISGYFQLYGEGDNQTSGFTETVSGISDIIAQKVGMSTQMAIKGSMGGSMKALNKELEQEAMAENPNLAMAEFLPKSLRKNPLALMGLNSIMQKYAGSILSGGSGSGSGSDNHTGQAKFNL